MEEIKHLVEWVTLSIEVVASIILLWGVVKALGLFSYAEILAVMKSKRPQEIHQLVIETRKVLGNYLLLGLELMIAADIIHTVISRTQEDLIFLGVLVVIRTLISYFLSKELETLEKNKQKKSQSDSK